MELTVEAMAYGAKGVARHEGKVYFIADAVEGDRVEAEIVSDSGRYAEAQVTSMVTPSPLRGPAACVYADSCGGCQWMGIAYPQQLAWKRSFVTSALTRIGKLQSEVEVTIVPAPEVLQYRNRVLLRAHVSAEGKLRLGYFRRQSRELVPIHACAIAAPALNELITQMHAMPLDGLGSLKARVEMQQIAPVNGRDLVVTVYPGEGDGEQVREFAQRLGQLPGVHWSGLVFSLRDAPTVLFEEDLERKFLTMPGQFQQVNVELNHVLRRLLHEHVEETKPARILDVFCGSGNLSLPLADGVRYIEGVESNKQAVAVARQNVAANGLSNTHYLAGDAEKHLWKCDRGHEAFDLVVLDPPRQGLFKGMVPLKNIAPKHIVYVSCDPTTLARDLGYLCRNEFYRLKRVVALDFFPNTYHVETVAFLELTLDNRQR